MPLKKTLLLTALLVPTLFATAHEYQAGELHIDHPWSRAMPPTAPTAAAYFVVRNSGDEADMLVSASSPHAGKVELHEHVHADGLMKMQQVQNVEVPAGGEVSFQPMGYHVMMFDLQAQAKEGEHFPLTLTFEKSGQVEVSVAVHSEAPGGDGGHGAEHGGHTH